MIESLHDILGGFLLGLGVLVGPPAAIALWMEKRNKAGFSLFLPLVLFSITGFFLISGFIARFAVPSVWTFAMCSTVAGLLCVIVAEYLRTSNVDTPLVEASSGKTIFAIALVLSTAAIVDCVWIYLSQSWGYDGRPPHVLSPMQLDPQRNANLVASILRGDTGFFLPDSPVLYQLLWYRGTATLLAALPDSTMRYFQIGGLTLLTGWILYLVLLLMILRELPKRMPKTLLLILLCAVILFDARIDDLGVFKAFVNLLYSEKEWIATGFQYFSIKLLVLTAPQHSLFLILLAATIYFRHLRVGLNVWRAPIWSIFAIAAVVASPVLAAFAMPSYAVADAFIYVRRDWRVGARRFLALCGVAVVAFILHWVVIGFPPSDLFGRTDAVQLKTLWKDGLNVSVQAIPLAPVAIGGLVLGLCAPVFVMMHVGGLWKPNTDRLYSATKVMVVTSVIVFVLWNVIITDVELRRHSSMVIVVLLSLATGLLATRVIEKLNSRFGWIAITALVGVGVALDYRLIDAFTSPRATTISADIPWGDYFAANRFLAQTMHVGGVIAASGEGVVLPIANNIATTLAPKLAIVAHQRVLGSGAELLSLMRDMGGVRSGDLNLRWLSSARRVGFDTVVWGPVEESMWGVFGRRVLLDTAVFLRSFGEVGVFQYNREDSARVIGDFDNAEKQAFLERVACNAYTRKRLRESSSTAQLKAGDMVDGGLEPGQNPIRCDQALLFAPLPVVPALGEVGREIDVARVAVSRQSSIRSRLAIHGPEHALRARSNNSEISPDGRSLTETERSAWWEIDLGRNYPLAAVQIERAVGPGLTNTEHFFVLISAEPFSEKLPEDPFKSGRSMYLVNSDWPSGRPFATPSAHGRFLRIQLDGEGILALNRVRVWERAESATK